MKTKNRIVYRIFILLLLCVVNTPFHFTLHRIQDVQKVQESLSSYENNKYRNSSAGNNKTLFHKITRSLTNRANTNNISNLQLCVIGINNTSIPLFLLNEYYFHEQDHFIKLYSISLVAQKIRLNH
jgi:hypothetical protein